MDVVCLGLMVCDILVKPITPRDLEFDTTRVEFIQMHSGGDAFNVAMSLATIGFETAILGKTGRDGFGDFLRGEASRRGIGIEGLIMSDVCGTATSIVLIRPDGERSFVYYGGANDTLNENDIQTDIIGQAKYLCIGSALAFPSFNMGAMAAILEGAKQKGVKTVVDVTQTTDQEQLVLLEAVLQHTDYFMPSLEEARILSGREDPDAIANFFLARGVFCVVIKMGAEGCFLRTASETIHVPAFKVEAKDTTGAGDSFVAGFVAAAIKGYSHYECCIFANAAGALSVQEIGATEGMKSYEEIMSFIHGHNFVLNTKNT